LTAAFRCDLQKFWRSDWQDARLHTQAKPRKALNSLHCEEILSFTTVGTPLAKGINGDWNNGQRKR